MTAVTLQDLTAWTERESVFWYIGGAFRTASRHLALVLLVPPLFLVVIVLAQAFPYRLRKSLHCIREQLPSLEDDKALGLLHDTLQLAFGSAKLYSNYCLSRSAMKSALDELDETIDSIDFVLKNSEQLSDFLAVAEKKASPELPLPLKQHTA